MPPATARSATIGGRWFPRVGTQHFPSSTGDTLGSLTGVSEACAAAFTAGGTGGGAAATRLGAALLFACVPCCFAVHAFRSVARGVVRERRAVLRRVGPRGLPCWCDAPPKWGGRADRVGARAGGGRVARAVFYSGYCDSVGTLFEARSTASSRPRHRCATRWRFAAAADAPLTPCPFVLCCRTRRTSSTRAAASSPWWPSRCTASPSAASRAPSARIPTPRRAAARPTRSSRRSPCTSRSWPWRGRSSCPSRRGASPSAETPEHHAPSLPQPLSNA